MMKQGDFLNAKKRALQQAAAPALETPKTKRGRPLLYKPEYCEEIVAAALNGQRPHVWSALKHGLSPGLINHWARKHPDFFNAKKEAEACYAAWYENLVTQAALGNIPGCNSTALVWLGKNVCGWRDRHDVEVKAEATETKVFVEVKSLLLEKAAQSEQERERIIAQLEKGLTAAINSRTK